jgi:hypothetical protein
MKKQMAIYYALTLFVTASIGAELYGYISDNFDSSTWIRHDLNKLDNWLTLIILTVVYSIVSVVPLILPERLLFQRGVRLTGYFLLPTLLILAALMKSIDGQNRINWPDLVYPGVFIMVQVMFYLIMSRKGLFNEPRP